MFNPDKLYINCENVVKMQTFARVRESDKSIVIKCREDPILAFLMWSSNKQNLNLL